MPRIFGSRLIDGKTEEKVKKRENKKKEAKKKHINQASVEFEDEYPCKCD